MKKHIIGLLLIIIFIACPLSTQATYYKVLKVLDGDTLIVDFNSNGTADRNERVRINGIDAFEVKNNKILKKQANKYNITSEQALKLGFLGKEFDRAFLKRADNKTPAYVCYMASGAYYNLFYYWVMNGYKESADELSELEFTIKVG